MANLRELATHNATLLNPCQQRVFDTITAAINADTIDNRLFFVDGPGGTGKSFIFNTIIAYVKAVLEKEVLAVATSGVASLLLIGGRTAHSTFSIPIPIQEDSTCYIRVQSPMAAIIRNAALLIWDEAAMAHRHVFEAVDRCFREVVGVDVPFGGKVVVFGGDFRQVLPVIPRGTQAEIENACLKNSEIWRSVSVLKLTENMRVNRSPAASEFAEYLLRIGEAREPTVAFAEVADYIRIRDEMAFVCSPPADPVRELLRHIYPDFRTRRGDSNYMAKRAILAPRNVDVDKLNAVASNAFPGIAVEYLSRDSIEDTESNAAALYAPEFLNSINPPSLPPHRLSLKIDQPIMLLRNLDPKQGMCNGTRLTCKRLGRNVIDAEIITGDFAGRRVLIPRILLKPTNTGSKHIEFCRKQFPIRPAFAFTINKAQGQTLEAVGVFLSGPVFSHGQLYVALSRCTDPANVHVYVQDGNLPGRQGTYTRNVVFRNVL